MLEEKCNIWDKYNDGEIVCITTNGFLKKNGRSTMGRGVAAQSKKYVLDIDLTLGDLIKKNGNVVQFIADRIIAFPVKPKWGVCRLDKLNIVPHMRDRFSMGFNVPGWAMMADQEIIERSLWELLPVIHECGFFDIDTKIYLPRPGCGAGGLKWATVKPLCEKHGDWLVVCDL